MNRFKFNLRKRPNETKLRNAINMYIVQNRFVIMVDARNRKKYYLYGQVGKVYKNTDNRRL